MSISSDVNQIHKTLFINSTATNEFEDIEDEKDEDIFTTTKDVITEEAEIEGDESGGNVLTSDEGLSLIQASKDYIDAVQSITTNPWDYNSWQVYLEEVEQGRGGATSIEEAYIKFLERYPLSAKIYKRLADYYYHTKNDHKQAEMVYSKCLNSCRSVTLYYDYLIMLKITTLDRYFSHKKDSIGGAATKSGSHISSSSMLDNESQYNAARNVFETAIEKSIEHVGMAIDANSVWRVYIDFIKEYPEIGTSDPGRKLQNLRKIYQRTVCIPMMELESFWKEYEVLEKSAGEHLAERVLPEYREKYNHARSIFKEREKLTSSIVFERLAVPPALPPLTLTQQQQSFTSTGTTSGTTTTTATNTGTTMSAATIIANNNMFAFESHQLDIWTKWIKYELSNPDQLPLEGLKNMTTYIYKKCLCCFRYHAEVWLNYSGFIYSIDTMIHEKNMKTIAAAAVAAAQSAAGSTTVSGSTAAEMRSSQTAVAVESRTILVQGIDVLPELATLRVALAELEEKCHFINILNNNITLISASNSESSGTNSDTNNNTTTTMNLLMARQILREAFELLPSAYTFTVYQRYLRRHEGITSARRLFSETSPLRLEKKLGCEIYLAHAQLECEVNCQPAVASRVLALAMNDDPASISNIYFIRYYIKVLLLLGDIQQIRWVSFTALGRDPLNFTAVTAGTSMNGSSSIDSAAVIQSNLKQAAKDENTLFSSPSKNAPPLHRYLVWYDLYHAETTLCQCNVVKLDMIKSCMHEAKRLVEDASMSHASTQRTSGSSGDKITTTSVLSSFSNLIDSTKNIFEKYPVLTVTETTPDMLLKTRMQYYSGGAGSSDGVFDSMSSISGGGGMEEYDMQRQQQHSMSGSGSSVTRRSQYQQQQSSSRGMRQLHDRDRERGGDSDRDRDQQQRGSGGQMDRDSSSSAISAGASSTAGVSFEALTQILSFIPITAPSVVPTDITTTTTPSTPVSQLMRDFLSRLPVYNGPALQVQELDQFVYHFRNLILPPRPLVPAANSAMSGMSDDAFFMPDGSGAGGGSSGGMMTGGSGGYNTDTLRERESVGYGGGSSNSTGVDTDDYYDEYVPSTAATPYQQQQQKYSMEGNIGGVLQQQQEDDDGNANNSNVDVFRQRRKDIKRRRE